MFFDPLTARTYDKHFQNLIAEIKSRLPGSEEASAVTDTRINDTKNLENISKHPTELPPGKQIANGDVNGGEQRPISTAVTKTKQKTNSKTKSASNDPKTNPKKLGNQFDKSNDPKTNPKKPGNQFDKSNDPKTNQKKRNQVDAKTNPKKPSNHVDKRNAGAKQKPGNKKQPVQSKNISSFFRAKNQSNQNDHRTKCRVKEEPAIIEIDSESQSPEILPINQETNCQPLNSTILPRNTKQQTFNHTISPQNTEQEPLNSTILPQKIKQPASPNTFSNSIASFSPVLGNKVKVHKDRKKATVKNSRTLFREDKIPLKQPDMLAYDSDSDLFNSSDSSESQSILQNAPSLLSNRKSPHLFICENYKTHIEHSTVLQESDIETESEDERITHLSGLTNEISNLVEEAIRNPPSQSHFEESLIPNAPTEFSCTQIESQ